MLRPMVLARALVMSVVLATAPVACEDEDVPSRQPGVEELPAWRTSDDRATATGLAWATGSIVHLPDGTEIDTGVGIRFFAVAGDGVFFVPVGRGADAGAAAYDDYELVFAAPGEPVVGTGMVVSSTDHVAASPDGRYLAVLDRGAGEKDRYGTTQATVLAFDLETGKQVVESTQGMGDPATDDFADGYSESEIGLSAMTDTHLHVQGFDDVVFDLRTGEGEVYDGLVPDRVLSDAMERRQHRLRESVPGRVVFPAWTAR